MTIQFVGNLLMRYPISILNPVLFETMLPEIKILQRKYYVTGTATFFSVQNVTEIRYIEIIF